MPENRRTPGWLPVAAVAVVLAVAALTGLFENPRPLWRLAATLVPPAASFADLPRAAMWSLLRLTGAYLAPLIFSWIMAYRAATRPAEARFILPLLDLGQSVPVLGFFPAAIFVFIGVLGGGRAALARSPRWRRSARPSRPPRSSRCWSRCWSGASGAWGWR
jgi:hypothetical protein